MRESRRYQWIMAAFVMGIGVIGWAGAGHAAEPERRSADGEGVRHYKIKYEPMNDSGVEATAKLTVDGDQLTVRIEAKGLESGQSHPMNIRGHKPSTAGTGDATVPPETADTSGDGLIDMVEGQPYYGAIVLPLTPFPSTSEFQYEKTFTIEPENFGPIEEYTSVLHGMSIAGSYVQTLPVACGEIKPRP